MAPEGENRRDRLARFNLERLNLPPKQGGRAGLERAIDTWDRFTAGSGWEKGFFAAGVLLIAGLAITAVFMLASNALGGGGGRKPVTAGSLPPTATLVRARPSATAIVIAVPTLPTAVPTDRADCNVLRDTGFKSTTERQFFERDCVTPTAEPAIPGPGEGGHPTQPPPPQPTQPPPSSGLTASAAIDLATYWITHNAPRSYSDAGSCNAVQTGSHWVVTCSAHLAGCQGSVCATTVSVCVFPDPLQVKPADQC